MARRLALLLTNWRFLAGTAFFFAYFSELNSIAHQPKAVALVGAICYAYYVVVSLLLTRA